MAGMFGHLNISDTDRNFIATAGAGVVWDAVQAYLERVNAELVAAMSVFVDETTEDFKRRFKLPGSGTLQRRGSDGRYGAVKAIGQWDVAFPLEDFGAQMASNDVDLAYMNAQELERHFQTIIAQNTNTVRLEMFKALFRETALTFVDPLQGSLTIQGLANGDAVVYPPVVGSDTEATDDHTLSAGYAVSAISDTNNPYETIRLELEEHFGAPTGGSNIVTFVDPLTIPKTEALTDFDPVTDRFTNPGTDTDTLLGLPAGLPGRIVGRTNGNWVVEWRQIPATYALSIHLDAPKPLIKRRDPSDTGLGEGLQLIAENESFPFKGSFWRHRFGFGVGNRLNGVAMIISASGYSVPSAFA
jgi:hypothetical protein